MVEFKLDDRLKKLIETIELNFKYKHEVEKVVYETKTMYYLKASENTLFRKQFHYVENTFREKMIFKDQIQIYTYLKLMYTSSHGFLLNKVKLE